MVVAEASSCKEQVLTQCVMPAGMMRRSCSRSVTPLVPTAAQLQQAKAFSDAAYLAVTKHRQSKVAAAISTSGNKITAQQQLPAFKSRTSASAVDTVSASGAVQSSLGQAESAKLPSSTSHLQQLACQPLHGAWPAGPLLPRSRLQKHRLTFTTQPQQARQQR